MIQIKENPVGVDVVINDIQRSVFDSVQWLNYNGYHRIYKNETSTGIIPEFYNVNNNVKSGEYEEVYLNDNLDASSFFYVADTINATSNGRMYNSVVSMVFQVNLSNLTGDNTRSDEEIHRDVILAINKSTYGKVNAIATGISNVYSIFDTTQLKWHDMQPYHCFRVDIDVSYEYDCCDNCRYESPIIGNEYVLI
jgi:hypothetical protein